MWEYILLHDRVKSKQYSWRNIDSYIYFIFYQFLFNLINKWCLDNNWSLDTYIKSELYYVFLYVYVRIVKKSKG